MKTQRYAVPRSTVGELQSAASAQITPQEAANLQMAKYGAIASGASAVSDVLKGVAEIKAEQELNDSVMDMDSALLQLDRDIEKMPVELDEFGNVVSDAEDLVKMEANARKSIMSATRDRLSTRTARRQFDKYAARLNMQRNDVQQTRLIEREKKTMEANSAMRVEKLTNLGRFEEAITQIENDVKTGVISAASYANQKSAIYKARSDTRITQAMLSPTITIAELELMSDEILNNQWHDGDMNLTSQERYAAGVKILSKMKSMEEEPGIEAENASKAVFDKLLPSVLDGKTSVEDLITYRDALGDTQFNKLLGYAVTERRRPPASTNAVLEDYDERASQLVLGYSADEMGFVNWEDTVDDFIHAMSMEESISQADYTRIKGTLDAASAKLRRDPELASMLDVEYQKLTGHTVAQSILGTVPKDKTAQIAGSRLLRDYYREVARLGPEDAVDGAAAWLDKNIPKYHAGVSDGILAKYDVDKPPMRDGTIDYLKLEEQMITHAIESAERRMKNRGDYAVADEAGQDQMMRDAKNKAMMNARVSFGVYKQQTEAR